MALVSRRRQFNHNKQNMEEEFCHGSQFLAIIFIIYGETLCVKYTSLI